MVVTNEILRLLSNEFFRYIECFNPKVFISNMNDDDMIFIQVMKTFGLKCSF